MFFSLERRPAVKAENPSFGVGKLAQKLAAYWKEMNSEEKEPYQQMALKDKERYATQLKAYKKGLFTSPSSAGSTAMAAMATEAPEEGSESGEGEGEELDQLVQFYQ